MASSSTAAGSYPPLYQPLNKDKREIRLLEILPNTPDDKVNCKLHTVLLTPDLYYTCIAYAWGDPKITEEIIVDGVPRQVTVTLATALRHVKKHWTVIEREADPELDTSKFRLWADALCINQSDLTERLYRVSMMADIYSSAAMVLAWLSSSDKDVSEVFKTFERLVHIAEEYAGTLNPTGLTEGEIFERFAGVSWDPEKSSWLSTGFTFDEARFHWVFSGPCEAVSNFCQLEFWNRVWVRQEIILARKLYFISPSYFIHHSSCVVALVGIDNYLKRKAGKEKDSLKRYAIANSNEMPGKSLTRLIAEESGKINEIKSIRRGMWYLGLYFSLDSEASNALDCVYGRLAVTESPIIPDYTESIREVNLEFMTWVVSCWKSVHKKAMDLNHRIVIKEGWRLGHYSFLNRHAVGLKRLYGLPSWTPVFIKNGRRNNSERHLEIRYCAFKTVPELFNNLLIDIVGDSFWVNGIKAQTVKAIYDEPVSYELMTTSLQKRIMTFTQSPQDMYPNGKSVLEVLCCTLLQRRTYENFAFNAGLCIGKWLSPTRLVPQGEVRRQWLQKPYIAAVLAEWIFAGRAFYGNKLFITEDGDIGTMPEAVLPGDVVCVLAASNELAVLRPEDDHYLFVGCCFMIGLMNGEVSEFLASGKAKIESIEIR
ncbi:hypothetical protein LB504_007050 [Fusarium proliferatum]|nr:hypothetical protein LB504_007050 [Fusarium proliferatum]